MFRTFSYQAYKSIQHILGLMCILMAGQVDSMIKMNETVNPLPSPSTTQLLSLNEDEGMSSPLKIAFGSCYGL